MDAIEDALHGGNFDEIIVSTLPRGVSRWLHTDLPHRVSHVGIAVTTVTPREPGDVRGGLRRRRRSRHAFRRNIQSLKPARR